MDDLTQCWRINGSTSYLGIHVVWFWLSPGTNVLKTVRIRATERAATHKEPRLDSINSIKGNKLIHYLIDFGPLFSFAFVCSENYGYSHRRFGGETEELVTRVVSMVFDHFLGVDYDNCPWNWINFFIVFHIYIF